MPDKIAENIIDGRLTKGDIGYIYSRSYMFIKDRIRDVVVAGGFNVYQSDVELVLERHQAVCEYVGFGVDDAKWGKAVHAVLEFRDGTTATADNIISFVKQNLDSVKASKLVHITDDTLKSAFGMWPKIYLGKTGDLLATISIRSIDVWCGKRIAASITRMATALIKLNKCAIVNPACINIPHIGNTLAPIDKFKRNFMLSIFARQSSGT